MDNTQNQNTPTNEVATRLATNFDSVSLDHLEQTFNENYKVSKGSASQVVLGFKHMVSRVQNPTNEYQQTLYPKLKDFCENVVSSYESSFLTTFSSEVERQVFGANLNGNRNNGSLYRSIPSGVNRNLTYNYAQFGQLLKVLTGRLQFVVNRDATKVQRYTENQTERTSYEKLQSVATQYLQTLTSLGNEWNTLVSSTRQQFGVETQQRPQRTERTEGQSRYQGQSQGQSHSRGQRYQGYSHGQGQSQSQGQGQSQSQGQGQSHPRSRGQGTRQDRPQGQSQEGWQTIVRRRTPQQSNTQSNTQSDTQSNTQSNTRGHTSSA